MAKGIQRLHWESGDNAALKMIWFILFFIGCVPIIDWFLVTTGLVDNMMWSCFGNWNKIKREGKEYEACKHELGFGDIVCRVKYLIPL